MFPSVFSISLFLSVSGFADQKKIVENWHTLRCEGYETNRTKMFFLQRKRLFKVGCKRKYLHKDPRPSIASKAYFNADRAK